MDKTFQLSGAVVLALALAGCGSSGSSSGDPVEVVSATGETVEVAGTWRSGCTLFGEGADAIRSVSELDISGDKISMTTMVYAVDDTTCSGAIGEPVDPGPITYTANGSGKASWSATPPAKGDGSGNWEEQVDVSLYSLSTGSTGSIFLDDTGADVILYTGSDDEESPESVQVLEALLAYKAVSSD